MFIGTSCDINIHVQTCGAMFIETPYDIYNTYRLVDPCLLEHPVIHIDTDLCGTHVYWDILSYKYTRTDLWIHVYWDTQ